MGLEMPAARRIALRFSLREDEKDTYKEGWELRKRADPIHPSKFAEARTETQIALERVFRRVTDLLLRRPLAPDASGMVRPLAGVRYEARRPTSQNYVVFSDHHMAYQDHRQNFFATSLNAGLYAEVLGRYYDAGYTLVENGDVEELVIFEPTLAELRLRQSMTWSEMDARRLVTRREQLARIINDPANIPGYTQRARFQGKGQYIRTAGNHDYNIQQSSVLSILRERIPDLPPPYDYVLLETKGRVDWVIMHGHQFDKSTTPALAPRIGEIISESLAWAYQGADRVWRWTDQVGDWALGRRAFFNTLVGDDVALGVGPGNLLRILIGEQHEQGPWEALFGHQVAWEYFENRDPQVAIDNEVKTGDEWFKYRHLDELAISAWLSGSFTAENRPKLVLGHTHEPRYYPSLPNGGWTSTYFNSGSAGRFENLIWGLEIIGGQPLLVGWIRPGGAALPPPLGPAAERHVFTRVAGELRGSAQPVPLS